MIDSQLVIWTGVDGIPLTDDNEVPIAPDAETQAIMHVSARAFVRYMEFMAESEGCMNMIDTSTFDMDPELKMEVVQGFLNFVSDDIRDSEKLLKE